jgi:hypothetical protein
MKGVPPKYYKLLLKQEKEIINRIESIIQERGYLIFSQPALSYFLNKIPSLAAYQRITTYSFAFGEAKIHSEHSEISEPYKQKLKKRIEQDDSDTYDIYYIDDDFSIPLSLTYNGFRYQTELMEFLDDNAIDHEYGGNLSFLLGSISRLEQTKNLPRRLAKQVAINHKASALDAINKAIEYSQLGFFLREAYALAKMPEETSDIYLLQDYPEIPYSTQPSNIKRAFCCISEDGNLKHSYEYLFECENEYLKMDFSEDYYAHSGWTNIISTRNHKNGSVIQAFGTELLLTSDGLTLLEMTRYGDSNLKVVHNFEVDEAQLIRAINDSEINGCTSSNVGTKLLHYYQLHKKAWVVSKFRRATTFTQQSNGLRAYKAIKTPLVNTVVHQYKQWNADRSMSVYNLNPDTPQNLRTLMMRHRVKIACEAVRTEGLERKLDEALRWMVAAFVISVPVIGYWLWF